MKCAFCGKVGWDLGFDSIIHFMGACCRDHNERILATVDPKRRVYYKPISEILRLSAGGTEND